MLTDITSYAPMHVYFSMNERDLLRVLSMYRERTDGKEIESDRSAFAEAEIPLFLGLADEEGYPHEGLADFADSSAASSPISEWGVASTMRIASRVPGAASARSVKFTTR